ncbi:MAG: 50S ribosomal protein L17 [Nitrospinaceae bacterium]
MRHLKAGRKFGRTSAHRKAMFRNMVTALIERERIRTTLPKAKELRSKVEKTITLGKKGTLHARRRAMRTVTRKETLQKLFGPIAERFAGRNGGYTRIIHIGNRRGDDAPMAFIELVEAENEKSKETPAKQKAKSRPKKEAPPAADKKGGKKKAAPAKTETGKSKKAPAKKTGEPAPKKASVKSKKTSSPKDKS